jgi:addiction module RelB/DinJ family antitoxin
MIKKTNSVSIQIRIKNDLLEEAREIFDQLDLTVSEAFRLFLNDVVRRRGINVDLSLQSNTNQKNVLAALDRLELSGKKLGDKWLSEQGLNSEEVDEEKFYNLLKYGETQKPAQDL